MSWVSGIVVYVILWWLSFFLVLPFGIKQTDEQEKGHMLGAPDKPKLWKKTFMTTLLAFILFAIYFWVEQSGLITIQRSYSG